MLIKSNSLPVSVNSLDLYMANCLAFSYETGVTVTSPRAKQ